MVFLDQNYVLYQPLRFEYINSLTNFTTFFFDLRQIFEQGYTQKAKGATELEP